MSSLRHQVVQGGVFLAIRQGAGILVGLVGMLVLTRRIGPASYGSFAAAASVCNYLRNVAPFGIGVYLIRRGEEDSATYGRAATLLLVFGLMLSLGAAVLLPFFGTWTRLPQFAALTRTMLVVIPLFAMSQASLAKLERHLDYQRVAVIDFAGQVLYYLVALPLAFSNFGAWAPAIGWIAQNAFTSAAFMVAARLRPTSEWDFGAAREMTSYGLGFSSSIWVWQLRTLVSPFIVGAFLGAEAVGVIAIAIRIVEYLSFVKTATWRISIAVLGRIQSDRSKLLAAISEGMRLQIVAIGPMLLAFAWLGPWIVPAMFGPRWIAALRIFPFVALSYLMNSMFSMHSSVLYVLQRNWQVTWFHVLHVLLFAGSALLLVPRLGLVGYGFAEIVALAAYGVIHELVVRDVGRPAYRVAIAWGCACGLGLFVPQLGWGAASGVAVLAILPATWQEVTTMTHYVRSRTNVA